MKKVMIMSNALYSGGAEKVLQTVLNHLSDEKYDITLYSMHREKIDKNIYCSKFKYRVVFDEYNGKSGFVRYLASFWQKIKGKAFNLLPSSVFYALFIRGKYDVEVAFIEGESTKIVAGSHNGKAKKLAWVHIDLIQNPWTAFLYHGDKDEADHYARFDKILCVSDSVRTAFVNKFGVDAVKVKTQYNPIDSEAVLARAKEQCDLPPRKRIRMIAVGRLVEQKGFDRLLRIVLQLKMDGFDFELYILGEGAERGALERFIKANRLDDRVFLLGFRQNPYPFMRASDLMVCSSRAEGFNTAVSEGVILGLPIVSTDCAGARELFGNEECGIICDNNDTALYQALFKVLSAPACLTEYHEAALRRRDFFSLQKSMNEIERLFDE